VALGHAARTALLGQTTDLNLLAVAHAVAQSRHRGDTIQEILDGAPTASSGFELAAPAAGPLALFFRWDDTSKRPLAAAGLMVHAGVVPQMDARANR